jgi:hypothetical protein
MTVSMTVSSTVWMIRSMITTVLTMVSLITIQLDLLDRAQADRICLAGPAGLPLGLQTAGDQNHWPGRSLRLPLQQVGKGVLVGPDSRRGGGLCARSPFISFGGLLL